MRKPHDGTFAVPSEAVVWPLRLSLPLVPRRFATRHRTVRGARLFMKQFLADVFTPLRRGDAPERPMHWLLAAAIVLPLAVFAAASAISYRAHQEEARDRLRRNLATVYEHALKVSETIDISARYLDEIFLNASDEQIRGSEAAYNMRLRALTETLPQLADIWIIDAAGHPLVSGTVFPIPRQLDLSDRSYFRAHKYNEVDGQFVDAVVQSRATNERGQPRFFAVSRKRTDANGKFAGVTTISVSPDYFLDYYAKLPPPIVAALIRETDGTVLARYPEPPRELAQVPYGSFIEAVRANPSGEYITIRSIFDGAERTFAYRKLPRYPVIVATGVDTGEIVTAWLH